MENRTNQQFFCHASIDETLGKFWEVETLPQRKLPTEEELLCEKIFQETTRVVDNRFVVKLPFKKDTILGGSLTQAQRRFSSLERRLDTNPELRKRYGDFIDEFVSLDDMEVVPEMKSTNLIVMFTIYFVIVSSKKSQQQLSYVYSSMVLRRLRMGFR